MAGKREGEDGRQAGRIYTCVRKEGQLMDGGGDKGPCLLLYGQSQFKPINASALRFLKMFLLFDLSGI